MTCATVEDSTGGLGQTLRTGHPLVGGLSVHDVSGLRTNPLAHRLPEGIHAYSVLDTAADEGLVSCSGGRPTTWDPARHG